MDDSKISRRGMSKNKVFRTWYDMKRRCLEKSHKSYPAYGARGITICPEWAADFWAFFEYIGHPPTPRHSIDRIDNNGNYEPGNVRWATYAEQRRNTSRDRIITHAGRSMHLVDWAAEVGLAPAVIHKRLGKNWPIGRALSPEKMPPGRKKGQRPCAN